MIRTATKEDAARLCEIYGPFCENSAVSFESHGPSTEEMAARIAKVTATYPWLVWEPEDEIGGYAYASAHRERAAYRWSVDVAIYLDPAHQRRGGGRLLYEELFRRLREQGFYSAFAGVALPNDASIALHGAMGFRPVGTYHQAGFKFNRWIDVAWFEVELQPKPIAPTHPRPPRP